MNTKHRNITLIASLLISATLMANEEDTFAGVSAGYTHLNVEQTNRTGAIILGNTIEEDGYNFQIQAGYNYSQTIALTLNYQRVHQDDTHLDNFFLGSEYKFQLINKFTPYIGANLGYSKLNWDHKPMNTTNNDISSGSWLIGVTAGVSYPIAPKLDLQVGYTLQLTDHTTYLESGAAKSELTHNLAHNLDFGVRWFF